MKVSEQYHSARFVQGIDADKNGLYVTDADYIALYRAFIAEKKEFKAKMNSLMDTLKAG